MESASVCGNRPPSHGRRYPVEVDGAPTAWVDRYAGKERGVKPLVQGRQTRTGATSGIVMSSKTHLVGGVARGQLVYHTDGKLISIEGRSAYKNQVSAAVFARVGTDRP